MQIVQVQNYQRVSSGLHPFRPSQWKILGQELLPYRLLEDVITRYDSMEPRQVITRLFVATRKGRQRSFPMDLLDLGVIQASDDSKKQKSASEITLRQRSKLRTQIRQLRKRLAARFGFGQDVYMVFNNKTLDALVLDLPSNHTELLKVNGFAKKRTESLGRFILPIIREYKRTMQNNGNHTIATPKVEESSEEDEVIFESHETIEDIVNRLFKEAQERGEVISL